MSTTPEALTRRWFKEVWDEGREDSIDRLLAPDGVVHGLGAPGSPPIVGPAGFKPVFHMFREAFGDLTIDIERIFVDGDICVAHCRVRGRHVGRALGGEPTRQPVDFQGITITRSKNGMLVEGWNIFDFLTMYQQIGWVRTPVAPST